MNIVLTSLIRNRLGAFYVPERASTEALKAVPQAKVARRMGTRRVGPRLSVVQRVQFYDLGMDWTDRLIVGDSRIVMDSFLECTRMAGKVEMLYVDPPASEASDDDPADVADSSLAYLRDRLSRCRDLLHGSGSIFVRLGEASPLGVRSVMDTVLGADNCCGIVTREGTSSPTGELLPAFRDYPVRRNDSAGDSLIWYSRDFSKVTYRHLLVALHFQAHYLTGFGEGRERRRRCGILLAEPAVPFGRA
jgi:adenine-specific DNA-methyltransferase